MRFNLVLRYIGLVLLLNAAFMLLSAVVGMIYGFDTGIYPLLLSTLLTATLGAFPLIFVDKSENFSNKESYVIVVGAWLLSCLVGGFPYLLWGNEFSLINTWFESVSGYTTTGSTILNNIEALPNSLLLWRSTTHWIGGAGVVMFAMLILPSLGRTKMALSNVELSNMAKDNYRYKTQKIIQILLFVYVGITVTQTICLKIAGMTWFDAVNHSFSTVATGGFSTKNMSIAHYDNIYIEAVLSFFMLLSGLHFGLIFATLIGSSNNIFRSEICRYVVGVVVVATVIISISLLLADIYPTFWTSLRYSLFQVISLMTTTGFVTADTNLWTPLAIMIIIFLTFQCASAGSTGGGIKVDRVLLAFKSIKAKILQQQHPNAIIRIRQDNKLQEPEAVNFANLFIACFLILTIFGSVLNTMAGLDLITAFSYSLSCLSNVGPGFGEISSFNNCSNLPPIVKFMGTIYMLLGRLEIFGFIQLFMIKWWR